MPQGARLMAHYLEWKEKGMTVHFAKYFLFLMRGHEVWICLVSAVCHRVQTIGFHTYLVMSLCLSESSPTERHQPIFLNLDETNGEKVKPKLTEAFLNEITPMNTQIEDKFCREVFSPGAISCFPSRLNKSNSHSKVCARSVYWTIKALSPLPSAPKFLTSWTNLDIFICLSWQLYSVSPALSASVMPVKSFCCYALLAWCKQTQMAPLSATWFSSVFIWTMGIKLYMGCVWCNWHITTWLARLIMSKGMRRLSCIEDWTLMMLVQVMLAKLCDVIPVTLLH